MATPILSAACPQKSIPQFAKDRLIEIARCFEGVDGCWEWPLSVNVRSGYGQLGAYVNQRHVTFTAHRLSFATFNGDLIDGMFVCHKCDNRRCFNPAHLYQGTVKENTRDMWERNPPNKMSTAARGTRHGSHTHPECIQRGTTHHASKLTDEIVRNIRTSNLSEVKLAKKYGVSSSTIRSAKIGETWTHVK